jgi:hypothetical protein
MHRTLPLLALCLTTLAAFAVEPAPPKKDLPKVVVVGPLGVPTGVATKIKIWGLHLDTATEVRFFEPKASAKVISKAKVPVPNNQSPDRFGDSLLEVEVLLPEGTTQPSVQFVVLTSTGEAPAHTLLVNSEPLPIQETEPNNGFAQAQAVPVPAEIEGTINGAQDVDVFRIEGKEGQHLIVDVHAARYGSPLDSLLTLYDAQGRVVTTNDDFGGSTDSHIEVALPRTGAYYLSVADANDQGGPQFFYRLLIQFKGQ